MTLEIDDFAVELHALGLKQFALAAVFRAAGFETDPALGVDHSIQGSCIERGARPSARPTIRARPGRPASLAISP